MTSLSHKTCTSLIIFHVWLRYLHMIIVLYMEYHMSGCHDNVFDLIAFGHNIHHRNIIIIVNKSINITKTQCIETHYNRSIQNKLHNICKMSFTSPWSLLSWVISLFMLQNAEDHPIEIMFKTTNILTHWCVHCVCAWLNLIMWTLDKKEITNNSDAPLFRGNFRSHFMKQNAPEI